MMKYFWCCLLFLTTLGHQIVIADYTPKCAVGWFGSSCQFKCRCQLSCHSNGECPEGCQTGWFGHKCQYQDLITSAQASLALNGEALSRLRDNNERTCITERTVTVDLKMDFYFSWLRAVVNYSQNYSLNVVFQNSNQQNVTCNVKRKIEVDKKYLDYQCFNTLRVRYVTLHVAGCQICSLWISGGKNVAIKLFTNQSTTYHDSGQAFNAVDGNTDNAYSRGSCTHTDWNDANPNWQLGFRPPAFINRIVIYNRQGLNSKRLKQFSMTTLNVDNIWSEKVPLIDAPLNTILMSSEKRLKMIVIDGPRNIPNNNEVFLTLCEVETYEECPEGPWGANCLKTCSPSCIASNKCEKITGECLDGCKPGFQMPSCEQKCIDGLFGANCSQPCSVFCEDKPCHYRDGTCTLCRPGYRGRHCSQTCDFGFYGRNCSEKCSPFCKYEICYPETGLCKSCIPGYRGGFCNEECQEGKWGDNCSSTCSSNCITYDTCNKMTGECQGGCKPGFQTPNCEKKCVDGLYGTNCSHPCPAFCEEKMCNHEDGTCSSCIDGYTGSHCWQTCDSGFYGKNCTELCSTFCKDQDCYPETGLCKSCSPGYTGKNCTEECQEGTWGDNCSNTCSFNCHTNFKCDKTHGVCQDGCKPGFQMLTCLEKCKDGTWGDKCSTNCSSNCITSKKCDETTGECQDGCKPGFQMPFCEEKCSEGTWGDNCSNICSANCIKNNKCDQITGECQDGCKPGFQIPNCEEKCFDGLHGANCSQPCSVFCEDKPCNPRDGTCTLCKDGYKGNHCLETCDFGFYGTNCSEKCSTFCKYEICYPQNGLCKSCIPGYRGGYCNEECDKGTWGDNCSKPCSTNCFMNNKCERITGKCQDGCKPGFQLPNCEEKCIEGFYGTNCSHPCSVFCEGKTCNHRDGSCTNCKEGYKGSHCLETCDPGFHGKNCTEHCSTFCKDQDCYPETGLCKSCSPGYRGDYCTEDCGEQTWGYNCLNSCSTNCIMMGNCDKVTGECKDGCKPGFQIPICDEQCIEGFYGPNCSQLCSDFCEDNTCDHRDGTCTQCRDGYKGSHCLETCEYGFYGKNCSEECSTFCKDQDCYPETGQCIFCSSGYTGDNCTEDCKEGTWGDNCSNPCSTNCIISNMCDKATGECQDGCKPGYQIPDCEEQCMDGFYGTNCFESCSAFCKEKTCNHEDGTCTNCIDGFKGNYCLETCDPGFYGKNCTELCSTFCKDQDCYPETGLCTSCSPGYTGDNCTEECLEGTWGDNCLNTCSTNCVSNTMCDTITGECQDGCLIGFQLPNCEEKCIDGFYGLNCSQLCSDFCEYQSCNHEDGTCTQCTDGYKGSHCLETCDPGFYGKNCTELCSTFCKDQDCYPETGLCKSCGPGYTGDNCNEDCEEGTWGDNCSSTCSTNCISNYKCDKTTGECQGGCQIGFQIPSCEEQCIEGFYGANCSQQCSIFCEEKSCNYKDGTCTICIDGYTGSHCLETLQSNSGDSAVITITIIILSLLIMAAVVGLIWRFRKQETLPFKLLSSSQKSIKKCNTDIKDDIELDLQNTETSSEQQTDSNIPNTTSVPVQELLAYLTSKGKEFLVQQFKSVPQSNSVTTQASLSDENKAENMHADNICPYDCSIICLKRNVDNSERDCINTSYVTSFKADVQFVAVQAPNKDIMNDFIRMLWEQKTDITVMLANTVENGKLKCQQHLPDKGTLLFGKIKVELLSIEKFADFSMRKLELSEDDENSHNLTQFHLNTWPDQDVPAFPWGLVEFYHKVSSFQTSKPIVVHSSAGVGSTGTFIGFWDLIDQAQKTGHVDFFDTLVRLRQDRIGIQTAEQYVFLHQAVLVASLYLKTYTKVNDFYEKNVELTERTSSGKTKLEEEYQNILNTLAYLGNELNSVTSSRKNRFSNIFPESDYHVVLASEPKDSGHYINTVFVQNFRHKNQHILTQLPMPQTLVDFWRMVTEYKVSLVVTFKADTSATDESLAEYLPSNEDQVIMCTPFRILLASRNETDLWEEKNVTVYNKSEHHKLVHLKSKFTDLDSTKLLMFVKQLRSYDVSGKTVYMCRNGATYSGLISVLHDLLDRLDNDTLCSIPITVGLIKTVRPQAISTLEQYKALFDILSQYTENLTVISETHTAL